MHAGAQAVVLWRGAWPAGQRPGVIWYLIETNFHLVKGVVRLRCAKQQTGNFFTQLKLFSLGAWERRLHGANPNSEPPRPVDRCR